MMRATRGGAPGRRATCHDGHAIGLDLGATAARATVLVVKGRDRDQVVEARTTAGIGLAPGTVIDGAVVDRNSLTGALTQLWQSSELSCRNVVLGVASPQVLVRQLEMPALHPAELAKALPFQARELVAMPLDQVVLDFAPLGPPDEATGMVQGLLVACPREPVLTAVAAVEAAGLRVVRVDLASLALLRSLADGSHDVEAAIDIGAHLTTIVVHQRGVPRLVRTLSRGGQELTTRLAKQLDIGVDQAEAAKRRSGLVADDQVSTQLRDLVAPLLGEIRSSLNYFRTSQQGTPIDSVALSGGGSALAGLPELLSQQIGVSCEIVEPSRLLVAPQRAKRPVDTETWTSALSVGLAIGAAA